jgi:hypothetical protein
MRWFKVAVALAVLGVVAKVADARVPAFARQTGLTCNQCHMSITPAMDFTWTGMKFRINGYRTPFVSEKIEAGDEGALNGNRLLLGLGSYMSMHVRTALFSQGQATSDPSVTSTAPNWGPVSSNLTSSLGWHYAGPMGEHVGTFNEFYIANTPNQNLNFTGLGHYQIVLTTNFGGGNIVGYSLARNTTGVHGFFTSLGPVAQNNQGHSPGAAYLDMYAYVWLRDRFAAHLGVQPGEDGTNTYRRMNYTARFGVFPLNNDAGWLMLNADFKAGNGLVPNISSLAYNTDGTLKGPTDAVRGISAYRANGQPYAQINVGDGLRSLYELQYGFIDRGVWSFTSNLSAAVENETYTDGAKSSLTSWGATARLYWNRTYGLQLTYDEPFKWNFTDASGVLHNIPRDLSYTIELVYRMAQNFAWWFSLNNSQTNVLDQNWRNGKSWSLNWQYLW